MLERADLIGGRLYLDKNGYENGGMFLRLLLAPKIKYCSTIDKHVIIQEHKTFKGLNDRKRLPDHSQYFKI